MHACFARLALVGALAACGAVQSDPAATIQPLSQAQRAAMTGDAWRPECPVPLDDLAAVTVLYVDFEGAQRSGTLVIHKRFAGDVAAIFTELHQAAFPIRIILPWENFGDRYAEHDATVGYYCRRAQDAPESWSGHAYGVAIDINPQENPFLDAQLGWWPAGTAQYAPRDGGVGKIAAGSPAFLAFARHGWAWGGFYPGVTDYMHFYKSLVGFTPNPLERAYEAPTLIYLPLR